MDESGVSRGDAGLGVKGSEKSNDGVDHDISFEGDIGLGLGVKEDTGVGQITAQQFYAQVRRCWVRSWEWVWGGGAYQDMHVKPRSRVEDWAWEY